MSARALFLVMAFTAGAGVLAQAPTEPIEYRTLHIPEGHFCCELPKNWNLTRDRHEEERIHYHGVFLDHDAPDRRGVGPAISIRYFAADNTLFDGAEGYLRRQFMPRLVKPMDEVTSEVREVTVAGQPAKTFTRDTSTFFPPDSLDSKRIPVRQEHYVLSYLDGFFIIRFEAPTESFASDRPILQRVLDTLQLLP